VAVFQKHKTISSFLELKNLTIAPEISRRFVASFLVRNVEIEAHGQFTHVICDAKKDNVIIQEFLTRNKYKTVANMDLYGLNAGTDTVYLKELK
jgi:ribosomal protein S18 acetylase RimI-like enzyme